MTLSDAKLVFVIYLFVHIFLDINRTELIGMFVKTNVFILTEQSVTETPMDLIIKVFHHTFSFKTYLKQRTVKKN